MKITFNTSQPFAPCSAFYIGAFKRMKEVTFYDQNYQNYDVALFMTYDHQHIRKVRENFPHLKIGIIDPRNYKVYESTQYCDFIIIDSVEMEDYWRRSHKPMCRYIEYPDIPYVQRQHLDKDSIIIGYHGNQIHLECMAESVTPALSSLGKKHNIHLLVMHNGSPPHGSEKWYPSSVQVKHVPWSMDNYLSYLSKCDIGIVPNNLIHNVKHKTETHTQAGFNYSEDDYSLRFKMPSNPGRFTIFGKLGIPVVADFYPSALQYLHTGRGFVAHHPAGWEHCLEKLIVSSALRQEMSQNLQDLVRSEFDFDVQNIKLLKFLKELYK